MKNKMIKYSFSDLNMLIDSLTNNLNWKRKGSIRYLGVDITGLPK